MPSSKTAKNCLPGKLGATHCPFLSLYRFLFIFHHFLPSLFLHLLPTPHLTLFLPRAQTGTLRENCLDCLDRSNSAQKLFGLRVSMSDPCWAACLCLSLIHVIWSTYTLLTSLFGHFYLCGGGRGSGKFDSACLPCLTLRLKEWNLWLLLSQNVNVARNWCQLACRFYFCLTTMKKVVDGSTCKTDQTSPTLQCNGNTSIAKLVDQIHKLTTAIVFSAITLTLITLTLTYIIDRIEWLIIIQSFLSL